MWMWIRLSVGCAILAILAIVDLSRHGRDATRWREYAFLVFCVIVAMAYGIVNDQITSRISWEYFYYGKQLEKILGPPPPYPDALYIQAIRIGASATWWFGLIAGAAMLIANNPSHLPRLPYRRLVNRLPSLIFIVAFFAGLGALAGYLHLLMWADADFSDMVQDDLWRPNRFMTVYGIHLGGYVGGLAAVAYNVWKIRCQRAQTEKLNFEKAITT